MNDVKKYILTIENSLDNYLLFIYVQRSCKRQQSISGDSGGWVELGGAGRSWPLLGWVELATAQ